MSENLLSCTLHVAIMWMLSIGGPNDRTGWEHEGTLSSFNNFLAVFGENPSS